MHLLTERQQKLLCCPLLFLRAKGLWSSIIVPMSSLWLKRQTGHISAPRFNDTLNRLNSWFLASLTCGLFGQQAPVEDRKEKKPHTKKTWTVKHATLPASSKWAKDTCYSLRNSSLHSPLWGYRVHDAWSYFHSLDINKRGQNIWGFKNASAVSNNCSLFCTKF